jgi:hypothetical protein
MKRGLPNNLNKALRLMVVVPVMAIPILAGTLAPTPTQVATKAPVGILFDLLNEGLGAQGYSANLMIHALEHTESSDSIYFYLLTREANTRALGRQ